MAPEVDEPNVELNGVDTNSKDVEVEPLAKKAKTDGVVLKFRDLFSINAGS